MNSRSIINRFRLLAALLGVMGLCGWADAQGFAGQGGGGGGRRGQNQGQYQQDQQGQYQQRTRQQFQQDQQGTNQGYTQGGGRGRGGFNQNNTGGFNNQGGFGGGRGRGRGRGGLQNSNYNPQSTIVEGDYSLIANKSIFSRDRRDPFVAGPTSRPAPPPPEKTFALTGVAFDQGANAIRAYAENLLQPGLAPIALAKDQAIAEGKVTEIVMNDQKSGISFLKDGAEKPTWIDVGSNLAGEKINNMVDARVQAQLAFTGRNEGQLNYLTSRGFANPNDPNAQGGQVGRGGGPNGRGGGRGQQQPITVVAPPPLTSDTQLSLEEKMKLRRMQESNPGAIIVPSGEGVVQQAPPPQTAVVAVETAPVEEEAQVAPAAVADPLQNLTPEERMRIRRLQEVGPTATE